MIGAGALGRVSGLRKKSGSENRRRCDPLLHLMSSRSCLVVFACRCCAAVQRAAQHALGQLAPQAMSPLLALPLRRFHYVRGLSFGLAAFALAPRECALSDFGEALFALRFGLARLLDQQLGPIVQVLESALALRQQVQERAKK